MHDRDLAARSAHLSHEVVQRLEVRFVESRHATAGLLARATHDADAHLHRHWNTDCRAHGGNAVRDSRGLPHEAGAEGPACHPVTGAPAVEVDLVIARLLSGSCGSR